MFEWKKAENIDVGKLFDGRYGEHLRKLRETLGNCIDEGHDLIFEATYGWVDGRPRVASKCSRCGYTKNRWATEDETAAIELLNISRA